MKKFCCPRCKNDTAEEIIVHAVIANEVKGIDDVCNEDLDYGLCGECNDGYIDRYQCKSCGYVIPNVNCVEDMVKWLNENGK